MTLPLLKSGLAIPANDVQPPTLAQTREGAMLVHVVNYGAPLLGARRFPNCEGLTVTEAIALAGWKLDYSTVLLRDSVMVRRAEWDDRLIGAGELVVLVTMMQGGGGVSKILAVVATIALAVFAPQLAIMLLGKELAATAIIGGLTWGGLATVGIVLAGTTLVSALLPKPKPGVTNTTTGSGSSGGQSPNYSLSAQANMARLYGVIPERFGRLKFLPDLATAAYFDFVNSEQELKEEFCLGMGEFEIEEVGVSNTPIWKDGAATGNYPEIELLFMAPAAPNTLFSNNVVTSSDVSNITLLGTNEDGATWSGPYPCNPVGTTTSHVEFDISLPGGLFAMTDSGALVAATVKFLIQVQVIDDAGTPQGGWSTIFDETLNQSTRDAIRTTYPMNVAAARYQARFARNNDKSSDIKTSDSLAMLAMRGYLPNPPPPTDTTRIAIKARSTENLNGDSAQKFYVIATRKLPIWNPDTGTWSAPTATRSIAAAAAYLCTAENGLRKLDNQVDLEKLATLGDIWDGRGDYFDGTFDTGDSAWSNLQAMLRVGRSEPLRVGRYITFNRDEPKTAYAGAFSPANILDGFNIDYLMFDANSVDAVWVTYIDARNWLPNKVYCALPDSAVDPADAPTVDFTLGVTDRDHAWREGMFMVACNRWRRRFPSFRTDLEGRACFRGSKILVSHWIPVWGASASVHLLDEFEDGDVLTLSEPWDERGAFEGDTGTKLIRLVTPDGHVYGPVTFDLIDDGQVTGFMKAKLTGTAVVASGKYVGQQPRDWGVWDGDGLDFERPRALFGTATQTPRDALLMSMKPGSQGQATIVAVLDDERVHTADGTVPPVEGDTPEPPAEGTAPSVRAPDDLVVTGISVVEVPQVGGVVTAPSVSVTVQGAPDAASFDARWLWNSASDYSPTRRRLARTFQFPSVGGSLTLQVRAQGRSGFGDWAKTTLSVQGVPPAPPDTLPAPSIVVTETTAWIAGSTDGAYSYTTDPAATSYLFAIDFDMGDGVWHTTNAAGGGASPFVVNRDITFSYPPGAPSVAPDAIRVGVKPVYPTGAAPNFVYP